MSELPGRDTTKPAEKQGLFAKFIIRRTDGSDAPGGKHDGCDYFVLDVTHDPHAKAALAAYAEVVRATHPLLADDMIERYGLAEPTTGNWIAAEDYHRNVRALDVALNGEEGAAQRPMLIDVLAQVEQAARELGRPVLAALAAPPQGASSLLPELVEALDALDASLDNNVPYGRVEVYGAMKRVKTALQPLLAASPLPAPQEPAVCKWTRDDFDSNDWNTDCGERYTLNDGTPGDNMMRFCCYCGKPVESCEPDDYAAPAPVDPESQGSQPASPARDDVLETLRELVVGLDITHWSSWQTTAYFWDQLEAARRLLEDRALREQGR